jgi:predicted metal-dependent hydrolase
MMPNHRNPTRHEIQFGSETIPFVVAFGEQKTLSIAVRPDCSVVAVAPVGNDLPKVLSRVYHRRKWIAKQRAYFEQFRQLPKNKHYISGETHLYLGRQYRLKVHKGAKSGMKLVGHYMHVDVQNPKDFNMIKTVMESWYHRHSILIFKNRFDTYLKLTGSLKLAFPKLQVRQMNKRWGSCSKAGVITLNEELVKTPLYCIEYVILHELCHLSIRKHGPKFFNLLTQYMPDWKKRKERLDLFSLQ